MSTRFEQCNETITYCSVKTAKGKVCHNIAQHVVLRRGIKITPSTNLRGHCHTPCSVHLEKAEQELER